MIEVQCTGFSSSVPAQLTLPVRPIELARATATMCGYAPRLGRMRGAIRRAAIVLEVLAHVRLVGEEGKRSLVVVGGTGMERTDRGSLSHRLGVGLARLVAERQPFALSHFYYVDGLIGHEIGRAPAITVSWSRGAPRKSADMIAADALGRWNVIEAKGRNHRTPSSKLSAEAKEQAQAVRLVDGHGAHIPVRLRIGSVAALDAMPIAILFADPPEDVPGPTYSFDPAALLWRYYEPVRDLVETYGPRLPRLSGEPDFVYGWLPGSTVVLAVHRRLVEAREDPEALMALRLELADELAQRRLEASTDGYDVDIGLDGLGIVIDDDLLSVETGSADEPRTRDAS